MNELLARLVVLSTEAITNEMRDALKSAVEALLQKDDEIERLQRYRQAALDEEFRQRTLAVGLRGQIEELRENMGALRTTLDELEARMKAA